MNEIEHVLSQTDAYELQASNYEDNARIVTVDKRTPDGPVISVIGETEEAALSQRAKRESEKTRFQETPNVILCEITQRDLSELRNMNETTIKGTLRDTDESVTVTIHVDEPERDSKDF